MKLHTLSRFAMAIMVAGLISSCNKDDETPPDITLVGDNPYEKTIDPDYVEPGYSATDDEDGDVTSKVVVTDDIEDKVGTYSVMYSVTDAAGNEGVASRTVIVKNAADALSGTYTVTISQPGAQDYIYQENIKMHQTVDNRIVFGKFGDYANNQDSVYANVTQVGGVFTGIQIPIQTSNQVGAPPANRTFSGNGTITVTGGQTTISMSVTETLSGGNSITSTYEYVK